MTPEPTNAEVTTNDGKGPLRTELTLTRWTKAMATRKGLRWGVAIVVCGLLTIFIPLVHFVTVPASILIGPLVGFLVYRVFNGEVYLQGEARCPACQNTFEVNNRLANGSASRRCPSCQAMLTIKCDKA